MPPSIAPMSPLTGMSIRTPTTPTVFSWFRDALEAPRITMQTAAPPSPFLQSGTEVGPFVILRLMESDGYTEVYEGRDEEGMGVVIHVTWRGDAAVRQRAEHKALLAQKLLHPCIEECFAIATADDFLIVVYEKLTGGSLLDVLRNGPLSPEDTFRFFYQILSGLEFAHSLGISHRRITPSSIRFNADRSVAKLTDFHNSEPIAQRPSTQQATNPLTFFGAQITITNANPSNPLARVINQSTSVGEGVKVEGGLIPYAAPEVLKGRAFDSLGVDVWGLGVLLHIMVTGTLPFPLDGHHTAASHLQYIVPSGIRSAGVRGLLQRLLCAEESRTSTLAIRCTPWWAEQCSLAGVPECGIEGAAPRSPLGSDRAHDFSLLPIVSVYDFPENGVAPSASNTLDTMRLPSPSSTSATGRPEQDGFHCLGTMSGSSFTPTGTMSSDAFLIGHDPLANESCWISPTSTVQTIRQSQSPAPSTPPAKVTKRRKVKGDGDEGNFGCLPFPWPFRRRRNKTTPVSVCLPQGMAL